MPAEKWLNNLKVPVFASENPITHHGREATSPAGENRFPRVETPDYSLKELFYLAVKISHETGQEIQSNFLMMIVQHFVEYSELAKERHLDAPSFRQFKEKVSNPSETERELDGLKKLR